MTWHDRIQLKGMGSWRGVTFFVDAAQSTVGRRTKVFKFPGRAAPFVEDQGLETREFRLTCYVVGPDYDAQRDKLREEFEAEGPGELVHPYWGQITCTVVSPVRISETFNEGGLARFELDLVQTTDDPLTTAQPDRKPAVKAQAAKAMAASQAVFEESFSLVGAVQQLYDQATTAVEIMASEIRAVRGAVNAALGVVDATAAAVNDLGEQAAQLVLAPAALAESVEDVMSAVMGAASDVSQALAEAGLDGLTRLTALVDGPLFDDFVADRAMDALTNLETIGDVVPAPQVTGSSQDVQARANYDALRRLFRVDAVVAGVDALVDLDLGSRDRVVEIRDDVAGMLDAVALDADDELWAALVDLRQTFTTYLNEVAANLPQVVEYVPPQALPALVIAYDLYGDATRDEEIIFKNRVADPNFVPGGAPVLVLDE